MTRVFGSVCLHKLKRDSACERCSLDDVIRWEIRVSKGVGSGPRMEARWDWGSIDDVTVCVCVFLVCEGGDDWGCV